MGQLGGVPSGSSRTESTSLPFPDSRGTYSLKASSSTHLSVRPLPPSSHPWAEADSSVSLRQDTCDHIRPAGVIQGNHPSSGSLI